MIRRFIPKGVDIAAYSKKEIERIQHWINNYPRKVLGGLSANMAKNLEKAVEFLSFFLDSLYCNLEKKEKFNNLLTNELFCDKL